MSETNGTPQTTANPDPNENEIIDNYNYYRNHDPQDLIRYHGQWVAWSRDGRKVLFASPDAYKLCEMIDAAGLKPDEYVLDGLDALWM